MPENMDDAMRKLRGWLRAQDIPQVDECETDADVIVLTVRVMDAMTKAYKVVTDMVELSMGVRDEADKQAGAEGRANERAARAAMRGKGGNTGRRKHR